MLTMHINLPSVISRKASATLTKRRKLYGMSVKHGVACGVLLMLLSVSVDGTEVVPQPQTQPQAEPKQAAAGEKLPVGEGVSPHDRIRILRRQARRERWGLKKRKAIENMENITENLSRMSSVTERARATVAHKHQEIDKKFAAMKAERLEDRQVEEERKRQLALEDKRDEEERIKSYFELHGRDFIHRYIRTHGRVSARNSNRIFQAFIREHKLSQSMDAEGRKRWIVQLDVDNIVKEQKKLVDEEEAEELKQIMIHLKRGERDLTVTDVMSYLIRMTSENRLTRRKRFRMWGSKSVEEKEALVDRINQSEKARRRLSPNTHPVFRRFVHTMGF